MITQQIGASTGLAPRHIIPLPVTIATPAIIAMVGAIITLVGSALPWVTIFRGTQTLTGWNGSPRYLAGLAVASVALTLLFLWAGRPAAFRRLAVLAGSTAVVGVAFASWQVAALGSSHSVSARILTPVLGPGPFVIAAGALLLLAVVAIPTSAAGFRPPCGHESSWKAPSSPPGGSISRSRPNIWARRPSSASASWPPGSPSSPLPY